MEIRLRSWLGKTSVNCVRSNREIKNDERGIDADRWKDFPGGKHEKLIKKQMMCEEMWQRGDPCLFHRYPSLFLSLFGLLDLLGHFVITSITSVLCPLQTIVSSGLVWQVDVLMLCVFLLPFLICPSSLRPCGWKPFSISQSCRWRWK